MDLDKLDPNLLPPPCGFQNVGATCYWNAFLQSIIGCTSFRAVLESNRGDAKYMANPVAQAFLRLFDQFASEKLKAVPDNGPAREQAISYNSAVMAAFMGKSPEIWQAINDRLIATNKSPMPGGQQDSNEIAMKFIDSMDELEAVQDLFMHEELVSIWCHICDEFVSNKKSKYPFFEIQSDLKSEQLPEFKGLDKAENTSPTLQDYLMKQNSYVDAAYKCPKCKVATARFKTTRLVSIPEILIVLNKIYHQRVAANYTPELRFSIRGGKNILVYEAISQVEHAGAMSGGHYWAVAKRASVPFSPGCWWHLNDASVAPASGGLATTDGTYMVFYHFAKME